MTEPRRFRLPWWWAVFAIALAEFLRSVITVPQRSFFPVYAQADLLYSALLISLLASLRQVLGMIGAPLGGILSDRIGPRWAFLLGMSELAIGSLAFITRWPPLVIACWAFAGLGPRARSRSAARGYLIEAARPAFLGAISGFYNIGMTLGGAVGNAISGAAGGSRRIRALRRDHPGRIAGKPAVGDPAAAQRGAARPERLARRLARLSALALHRREVLSLTFFRFLPTCYWGVALVFIPLRVYNATGSASAVAWYGTVSLALASLSQWVTGFLADRVGRKIPTLAMMSGIVLGGAGVGAGGRAGLGDLSLWRVGGRPRPGRSRF